MTLPLSGNDLLLRRLLNRSEQNFAALNSGDSLADRHPDEETLALFAEGLLAGNDRAVVVDHLSTCSSCRSLIGLLWKSDEATTKTSSAPVTVQVLRDSQPAEVPMRERSNSLRSLIPLVAVAVLVLMAVMTWHKGGDSVMFAEQRTYLRAEQLLASADFGNARRVLEDAERSGVYSGRLLSLNLQALRELPGSLSLNSAGTLLDFGYDLDGTLSRDIAEQPSLKEAAALLESKPGTTAVTEPLELILNRGHLRLSQNDFEAAIVDFQKAIAAAPEEPVAWLGLGLAEFAANEFEKAESEFQHCIQLGPGLVSAHINLAMTLEELGRIDEAREEWKLVLTLKPTDNVRNQIERHLEGLK
jgi:tetratricopeptide (TPR) repeat protein